jgi:Asp-tRNA(Asn)/Glu-tRNA(Gln) amidotransferase A subunit family amidase
MSKTVVGRTRSPAIRPHRIVCGFLKTVIRAAVEPFAEALPAMRGDQEAFDCWSAAYGGLPAIVVPTGFTSDGLPVGLELMGRPLAEPSLIAIAAGYEAHTDHRILPPTTPPLKRTE